MSNPRGQGPPASACSTWSCAAPCDSPSPRRSWAGRHAPESCPSTKWSVREIVPAQLPKHDRSTTARTTVGRPVASLRPIIAPSSGARGQSNWMPWVTQIPSLRVNIEREIARPQDCSLGTRDLTSTVSYHPWSRVNPRNRCRRRNRLNRHRANQVCCLPRGCR